MDATAIRMLRGPCCLLETSTGHTCEKEAWQERLARCLPDPVLGQTDAGESRTVIRSTLRKKGNEISPRSRGPEASPARGRRRRPTRRRFSECPTVSGENPTGISQLNTSSRPVPDARCVLVLSRHDCLRGALSIS